MSDPAGARTNSAPFHPSRHCPCAGRRFIGLQQSSALQELCHDCRCDKTGNGSVFRLADGNNGLVAIASTVSGPLCAPHSSSPPMRLNASFRFEFISARLVAHMQKAASPRSGRSWGGPARPAQATPKAAPLLPTPPFFVDLHYPYSPALAGYRASYELQRGRISCTRPRLPEVRPVTSASYILFFLSSSITILYHAAGRASIYIKKFAISSALCYHNELITRQAARRSDMNKNSK